MSQSAGAQAVDEIRQNVACPKCEYNLFGLRGAVVNCPECGEVCDVAALVSKQWTKPWHEAPGFSRLAYPAVVFAAGFVVTLLAMAMTGQAALVGMTSVATVLGCVAVLVWLHSRSKWFGVIGGLCASAIVLVMLAGALSCIISGLGLVRMVQWQGWDWTDLEVWIVLGLLLAGFVLLAGGHRAERALAQACIGRYLAGKRLP